jgi:hypothetical protein
MADDTAAGAVKNSNDGTTQAPQGGPMSLGGAGSGTYWDAVNKTWVVTDTPPLAPATNVNQRLTTQQAASLSGNTETGTNPAVKKLTETQSVNPDPNATNKMKAFLSANKENLNAGAGTETIDYGNIAAGNNNNEFNGVRGIDQSTINYSNEGRNSPGPAGPAGAGAPGEDGQTSSNTQQILNSFSNKSFTPKDNILDQYASYTYNLSWYLMNPISYAELVNTGKINYALYSLLAQSGGAPATPEDGTGRNKFFELDYYLDDLDIKSVVTGKGTGRAHNATEIQFTITETAGITLIPNIVNAVKSVYKNVDIPYVAALYCMVIKFYGYDDNGKLVQANNSDNNNAVVEKIIPFKIRNITFVVANKLVEYKIEAVAIPYTVGFGSNLGVIKAPIEITGTTVKDLLMSGIANADISADDGRQTSNTPTYSSPLTNSGISNTDSNTVGGGLDVSQSLVGA